MCARTFKIYVCVCVCLPEDLHQRAKTEEVTCTVSFNLAFLQMWKWDGSLRTSVSHAECFIAIQIAMQILEFRL